MESICVENTAITNGVAKSIKDNLKYFKKDSSILDYGAGKLRNTIYLANLGYKVTAVDTEMQIERVKKSKPELLKHFHNLCEIDEVMDNKYDVVLSTFVLCVVPEIESRRLMIETAYELLNKNGVIIVEVRTEKDILQAKTKNTYLDGYLIGSGNVKTFQKGYSLEELTELITNQGFDILHTKKHSSSIEIVAVRKE